jgi:NAD(P)-dependent dehydrogenase (short-subunit alcohol dehydrogenase family)
MDSFNVNVIGVVKTINTFMPLIKQSSIKKVVTITTGMADPDLVNNFEIDNAAPYAISKSATNMMVAKYNALYKKDGVLFLAISPGLVDTGHGLREFRPCTCC